MKVATHHLRCTECADVIPKDEASSNFRCPQCKGLYEVVYPWSDVRPDLKAEAKQEVNPDAQAGAPAATPSALVNLLPNPTPRSPPRGPSSGSAALPPATPPLPWLRTPPARAFAPSSSSPKARSPGASF